MTPWAVARQAPLSIGFPRQEYWSGVPFPPPGDLPDSGTKPESLRSPALAGGFFTTVPPAKPLWSVHMTIISVLGFPLYKLHILCSFFYCFAIFFLRIHKIGFGQNEQLPHSNSFLNFVPGALYWKESFNLEIIKSNPFFFLALCFVCVKYLEVMVCLRSQKYFLAFPSM